MSRDITSIVRSALRDHGGLAVNVDDLDEQADLYGAGLSSHASVSLMLALEERLEIEFPERMLRRGVFASISAIRANLRELMGADV
jgi:acyl carrier protein